MIERARYRGRCWIDTEKQAALLLAGSIVRDGDRMAIHGFSSNTRTEVPYYRYRLLEFGELPTAASRGMMASVQARYPTRMGATLRHATVRLQQETDSQRAILIVTGGAPSDIDVYGRTRGSLQIKIMLITSAVNSKMIASSTWPQWWLQHGKFSGRRRHYV